MDATQEDPIVIQSDDDDDDDVVLLKEEKVTPEKKDEDDHDVIFVSEEPSPDSKKNCSGSQKNKGKSGGRRSVSTTTDNVDDNFGLPRLYTYPSEFSTINVVDDIIRPLDLSQGTLPVSGNSSASLPIMTNMILTDPSTPLPIVTSLAVPSLKSSQGASNSSDLPEHIDSPQDKSQAELDISTDKLQEEFDLSTGKIGDDLSLASTETKPHNFPPLKFSSQSLANAPRTLNTPVCKVDLGKDLFATHISSSSQDLNSPNPSSGLQDSNPTVSNTSIPSDDGVKNNSSATGLEDNAKEVLNVKSTAGNAVGDDDSKQKTESSFNLSSLDLLASDLGAIGPSTSLVKVANLTFTQVVTSTVQDCVTPLKDIMTPDPCFIEPSRSKLIDASGQTDGNSSWLTSHRDGSGKALLQEGKKSATPSDSSLKFDFDQLSSEDVSNLFEFLSPEMDDKGNTVSPFASQKSEQSPSGSITHQTNGIDDSVSKPQSKQVEQQISSAVIESADLSKNTVKTQLCDSSTCVIPNPAPEKSCSPFQKSLSEKPTAFESPVNQPSCSNIKSCFGFKKHSTMKLKRNFEVVASRKKGKSIELKSKTETMSCTVIDKSVGNSSASTSISNISDTLKETSSFTLLRPSSENQSSDSSSQLSPMEKPLSDPKPFIQSEVEKAAKCSISSSSSDDTQLKTTPESCSGSSLQKTKTPTDENNPVSELNMNQTQNASSSLERRHASKRSRKIVNLFKRRKMHKLRMESGSSQLRSPKITSSSDQKDSVRNCSSLSNHLNCKKNDSKAYTLYKLRKYKRELKVIHGELLRHHRQEKRREGLKRKFVSVSSGQRVSESSKSSVVFAHGTQVPRKSRSKGFEEPKSKASVPSSNAASTSHSTRDHPTPSTSKHYDSGLKKIFVKRQTSMLTFSKSETKPSQASIHRSVSDSGLGEKKNEEYDVVMWCVTCVKSHTSSKLSKCASGHGVCITCLEVQVKGILTGDVKQKNIKCPANKCSEILGFDELRRTMPPFVVDVLEEKLDKEYLSYITKWMFTDEKLKSRSEFATSDTRTPPCPALNMRKYEEIYAQESRDPTEDLPTFWSTMERGAPVMAFEVVPGTEEYSALAIQFHDTLNFPHYDIVRIIRIQNPILWQYFALKRSEMVQENDGMDVTEKQLYHGTHWSTLESIARKGFDWRLSGKHGTVYGCGSYFARDARYSHGYTDRAGSGISVKSGPPPSGIYQRVAVPVTGRRLQHYNETNSLRTSVYSHIFNLPLSQPPVVPLFHPLPPGLASQSQPPQPPPAHYHLPPPPPAHGQMSSLQVPAHNQFIVGTRGQHSQSVSSSYPSSSATPSGGLYLPQPVSTPLNPTPSQGFAASQPVSDLAQEVSNSLQAYKNSGYFSCPTTSRDLQQNLESLQRCLKDYQTPNVASASYPVLAAAASVTTSSPQSSSPVAQLLQNINSLKTSILNGSSSSHKKFASLLQMLNNVHARLRALEASSTASSSKRPPASSSSLGPPNAVCTCAPGSSSQPPPPYTSSKNSSNSVSYTNLNVPNSNTGYFPPWLASCLAGGATGGSARTSCHKKGTGKNRPGKYVEKNNFTQGSGSSSSAGTDQEGLGLSKSCGGPSSSKKLRSSEKGSTDLGATFSRGPNSETHFMFVARVLVGRHTGGSSGLKRPPPLDKENPYGKSYDSCVDNIFSPQVFVIFDSNQAYPEYVIEYSWNRDQER